MRAVERRAEEAGTRSLSPATMRAVERRAEEAGSNGSCLPLLATAAVMDVARAECQLQ
jgi:hypothetical protein